MVSEVQRKILDYALNFSTHGPRRVSNELRLSGTEISRSGVRGVWLRHGIETRYKRLIRLEQHAQGDTSVTWIASSGTTIWSDLTRATASGRTPAQALMEALNVTEPLPTAA